MPHLCAELAHGVGVKISENAVVGMVADAQPAQPLLCRRGGKGVKSHEVTEKTGDVAAIAIVEESSDLMLITNEGIIIRTAVKDIRVTGRASQGVILMRAGEDARVNDIAITDAAEAEDAEDPAPVEE